MKKCVDCGHVHLWPMPSYEEIPAFYPSTYYTGNSKSALNNRGWAYRIKLKLDARKLKSKLRGRPIVNILDVGSGDTDRLAVLCKEFGATGSALDLYGWPDHLKHAHQAGISCYQGNVEIAKDLERIPDSSFDLILMRQLIEHLCEPLYALVNLKAKLRPGGIIVIETPNLAGLDYHLFRKSYWGGYHIPRHLHLFTQKSLGATVERTGYHVIEQGCLPSIGFWIVSLRIALGLDCAGVSKSFWEFVRISNSFVAGFFTVLDMAMIACGQQTSNQYVIAERCA